MKCKVTFLHFNPTCVFICDQINQTFFFLFNNCKAASTIKQSCTYIANNLVLQKGVPFVGFMNDYFHLLKLSLFELLILIH